MPADKPFAKQLLDLQRQAQQYITGRAGAGLGRGQRRGDLALEVSDKTKGNMDRLGTNGPRSFSGVSARIAAVDCSKVDFTEVAHGNHQYYRLRPEVIAGPMGLSDTSASG